MRMTEQEYGKGYGPWSCPQGGFHRPEPKLVEETPAARAGGIFAEIADRIAERMTSDLEIESSWFTGEA